MRRPSERTLNYALIAYGRELQRSEKWQSQLQSLEEQSDVAMRAGVNGMVVSYVVLGSSVLHVAEEAVWTPASMWASHVLSAERKAEGINPSENMQQFAERRLAEMALKQKTI